MSGIITEIDGYAAFIIRPNWSRWVVSDVQNPFSPDLSVWLVDQAFVRARTEVALSDVQRAVRRWLRSRGFTGRAARLMVDTHIQCALDHPNTPFAIKYVHEKRDVDPFAVYRGDFYTCWRDGSLTSWGERDPSAPTSAEWWAAVEAAVTLVKATRP